jgi:hypothetical protein
VRQTRRRSTEIRQPVHGRRAKHRRDLISHTLADLAAETAAGQPGLANHDPVGGMQAMSSRPGLDEFKQSLEHPAESRRLSAEGRLAAGDCGRPESGADV